MRTKYTVPATAALVVTALLAAGATAAAALLLVAAEQVLPQAPVHSKLISETLGCLTVSSVS